MARTGALTDAEAQHLLRIWEDCRGWLGPDTELLDVRREPAEDGVRLVATYRLGEQQYESAGSGETMLAAHIGLRERILVDRIRFGFTEVVDRR
jgi:hypothetical protein